MILPPVLTSCQIVENKELLPGYFLMKLNSPVLAERSVPGQFFHIKTSDRMDIILRRPFSLFDSDDSGITILYEVVGKGTLIMAEKKPGEEMDILGPLGNGFTLPPDTKDAVVIGGGMGVAPLFAWTKELLNIKKRGRQLDIKVLMGFNNKNKVLCEEDFKNIGIAPEICTDDGSYCHKGFVTDLLKVNRSSVVYGCGPNNMLKELSKILVEQGIPGQISLDRHMGCGVGVCLGCVVKTKDGSPSPPMYIGGLGKYKRVCKDGPVFNANEVVWE